VTRSERRRAEKQRRAQRREQKLHALLQDVAGVAYAVPLVSGAIMWWVSGSVPLALAILGAGLAAVSAQLARFYELQIRQDSSADDLRLGDGQKLSRRRRKAGVRGRGAVLAFFANDPAEGGGRGGGRRGGR